ncbi:MAG: mechanosensitive ion channel [Candidatus Marinimicrobia bacterium]|nr:mechanosensitive ion channel [Candidatus Neomarinimicrobiota bacterium]
MEDILKKVLETVALYGPRLLGAIAVLIIGGWLVKAINKTVGKGLEKSKIDSALEPFLKGIVSILLKTLLFISVLTMVGIEMMSFTALIGAAGLAVGMALSGTLQNFAGGAMILAFKPFRVGDFIDAQGYMGTVSEIQIFNTHLKTVDNKTIIIPNGGLSTGSMTNFSVEPRRRVDWKFGIAYGDSTDKAKEVIKGLCDADERILKDPEVFIGISELGDSSVNFAVRAWVESKDYWDVFFAMNENVYKTFEKEGLNIPFPQMDVHVHN